MSSEILEAMRDSIDDVFAVMFGMNAQFGSGLSDCDRDGPVILSSIDIHGADNASLSIYFDSVSASNLAERMVGKEHMHESDFIEDAIRELSNMVAGGVKRRLGDNGPLLFDGLTLPKTSHHDQMPFDSEEPGCLDFFFGVSKDLVGRGRLQLARADRVSKRSIEEATS